MSDAIWQQSILNAEGLSEWTIKRGAADSYCWLTTKVIQLSERATDAIFLHEVAHALFPQPEPNHYHGGGWADTYQRLVEKYMTRIDDALIARLTTAEKRIEKMRNRIHANMMFARNDLPKDTNQQIIAESLEDILKYDAAFASRPHDGKETK